MSKTPEKIAWLAVGLVAACRPQATSEPPAEPAPQANAEAESEPEPPTDDETIDADEDQPDTLPATAEDTQHVTFDAGDAATVPADGVATQPKREPLPSMMSGMRFGPNK